MPGLTQAHQLHPAVQSLAHRKSFELSAYTTIRSAGILRREPTYNVAFNLLATQAGAQEIAEEM